MRRILAGLLCLLFSSCETKVAVVTPEIEAQMRRELVEGKAVLDCNLGCVGTFSFARPQMKKLYVLEDWTALSTEVMRIGFQYDLAYFYLGRAAEGMGAYEAAQKYYKIAGYLATSPTEPGKCGGGASRGQFISMDLCDGFRFPRDIYPRLAFVQSAARGHMTVQTPSPYAATRDAASPVAQISPPARPVSQIRHTASAPKPSDAVTAEADWVRPPPTTR